MTFLTKCDLKYGDKYDYSKINYVNSTTKIVIRCVEHDNEFSQAPAEHLRGKRGCNLCKRSPKYSTDSFIVKCRSIHGDKYDYSKVTYANSSTKVVVICNEHGDFKQLPTNHMLGQGCPTCGIKTRASRHNSNTDNYITKCNLIHDNKYDYSKTIYVTNTDMVTITCPTHGDFEQLAYNHLRGKGCPLCGRSLAGNKLTLSITDVVDIANRKHEHKYKYSGINYRNTHDKLNITCPTHGEFKQVTYDHLDGHGCSKCTSSVSNIEIELNDYLKSIGLSTITSSRNIIPPLELDIYISSHKLAIEFDGLYWHSEEFKSKDYHLKKTEACKSQDIRLIHIFEDEWLNKEEIVKSRLKNILGLTDSRIYGRNCEVREVSTKDKTEFLNINHIQGTVGSSVNMGLYNNNLLVSIMTFTKPRLGIGKAGDYYELSRFCNLLDTSVIGGASKLLKHFISNYKPNKIISYADRRWSQGQLYDNLRFDASTANKPNYWYIIGKNRKHRFGFRKHTLAKHGYDTENKTEHQIMLERGIYRIYDCGTIRYELIVANI